MEITNLHFNETELCDLLVYVEQYLTKLPEGSYKEQVQRTHDKFNEIWFKLNIDEEYFIASKPF